MSPDELDRLIACHVPGEGAYEVQRIGSGLINETYRVLRGGTAYSLRLAATDCRELGADRPWESRVVKCAADVGLAPAEAVAQV